MIDSPNPENVEAFQRMLLKLRNLFLNEMSEKLDRLEYLLVSMEKAGSCENLFHESYRIVHSMKGSGGTHGLHIITTICHQLEDLMSATEDGAKFTPALITVCLNYVDLLRTVGGQIQAGVENIQQIEERLAELRKQLVQKKFAALIVEPSHLLTGVYLKSLAGLPVRIVAMTDGLQALMRALTEPFDFIITANEIPMLSGVALIGALKLSAGAGKFKARTILITGDKCHINRTHLATDADHVILKDSKLAQNLEEVIRQLLPPY